MEQEYEVIPTYYNEDGDSITHNASGFCFNDPACPCHEDQDLIHGVYADYQQGLVTGHEATNITQGRVL